MKKPKQLKNLNLLHYFEDSTERVASASESGKIHALHARIEQIRTNEQVGIRYMQAWEEEIMIREQATGLAAGEIQRLGEIDMHE